MNAVGGKPSGGVFSFALTWFVMGHDGKVAPTQERDANNKVMDSSSMRSNLAGCWSE